MKGADTKGESEEEEEEEHKDSDSPSQPPGQPWNEFRHFPWHFLLPSNDLHDSLSPDLIFPAKLAVNLVLLQTNLLSDKSDGTHKERNQKQMSVLVPQKNQLLSKL